MLFDESTEQKAWLLRYYISYGFVQSIQQQTAYGQPVCQLEGPWDRFINMEVKLAEISKQIASSHVQILSNTTEIH